jgi:hypothetical protein
MSEYDDILQLSKTGCWPNYQEPVWAVELARKYDCASTHAVVLLKGAIQEIERLRAQLMECKRLLHEVTCDPRCVLGSEWITAAKAAGGDDE